MTAAARAAIPCAARTFDVEDPCPSCGNVSVFGFLFVNAEGEHMHTKYLCRIWGCNWEGWFVPTGDDQ